MTIGNHKVKFGRRQINKPTPSSIAFWVKAYTIIAGVFTVSMESFPAELSAKAESWIHWLLGFTIAGANGLLPLFGVDVKQKDVPLEDVKEMETQKD